MFVQYYVSLALLVKMGHFASSCLCCLIIPYNWPLLLICSNRDLNALPPFTACTANSKENNSTSEA